MRIFRGIESLDPDEFESPVATIGVFDGMHLGHRAVIDSTRDLARRFSGESVAVTFSIHPRFLLNGKAPAPITSLAHRLVLMERYGLDKVLVLPFDDTVRTMSAADFADRVFLTGMGAKGLVLGFDSRFGKDRRGDLGFLREWAKDKGIRVRSAPPVLKEGRPISSSAIRSAIAQGEHDLAQAMLGRPVAVYGKVVKGRGRGRDIGFATANLDLEGELCPPSGVYAGWARRRGRWLPALVNIGGRPTFDGEGAEVSVEVHIPGIDEDLYGEEIEVQFLRRLRDERRFPGVEQLVAQIREDRKELFRVVDEVQRP